MQNYNKFLTFANFPKEKTKILSSPLFIAHSEPSGSQKCPSKKILKIFAKKFANIQPYDNQHLTPPFSHGILLFPCQSVTSQKIAIFLYGPLRCRTHKSPTAYSADRTNRTYKTYRTDVVWSPLTRRARSANQRNLW